MEVKRIDCVEQLDETEAFFVNHLMWGTKKCPKTYGYIGFIPEQGFCLKMICEEKNPLNIYKNNLDPVYKDSAMEAFFLFPQKDSRIYLNLEFNSNGALLAQYGEDRNHRCNFTNEMCKRIDCMAHKEEDRWVAELKLPLDIIEEICHPLPIQVESQFYCNFYKISETKEIEHYAAYSPVKTETPDFHRPEYFMEAVISRK
ncbi:MAG: carbohydrate-binding family 9-like protein [Dorea sp.]